LKLIGAMEVVVDHGAILLPVRLEGHAGFMVLQLDAGLPWLYPEYLEELGLAGKTHRVEYDGSIGSQKVERQVTVKSTVLDKANFTGWEYAVHPEEPGDPPRYAGYPVFGTLSSRFMNVVDMELNLAERRINLFNPNRCSTTPVYWGGAVTAVPLYADATGLLLFQMEVEGTLFEASLNTTGPLSLISDQAVKRYLGFDENSPGVERETISGSNEIASFRAMSLTAKGLNIRNTRVLIRGNSKCIPGGRQRGPVVCRDQFGLAPFSIGTDLMRKLRIYASVADKKIYFTRVEPAAAAATAGPDGANSAPNAAQ